MMSRGRNSRRKAAGSALVITLVVLVLITVIVLGYLSSVLFERKAARSSLNEQKAHDMAMLAMHSAVAQLRDGLGTGTNSWDNPFGNFMGTRAFTGAHSAAPVVGGSAPAFFWSISPGLLTRWDYTTSTYAGLPAANKIALFSGTSGGTNPTVNLNRSKSDGTYPIIVGTNAPPVDVQWVDVLSDPSQPASPSSQPYTTANKVIGRFAFWVDDENAKININTADGANKNDPKKSLGAGTPSEVSLQALTLGGSPLPATTASNIVQIARTTGFHSAREILRAQGTTPDFYSDNVFNLTFCGRSPELNIFGEPKINLIPASPLPSNAATQGYLQQNNITTQPLTEIYPAPAQLGAFTITDITATNPVLNNTQSNPWHPLVMTQEWPMEVRAGAGLAGTFQEYSGDRGPFFMSLISQYLSGTNSMGKAIKWPVFPGSGTNGFMGKYSLRQLDSISVQIGDVAGKAITPEETNPYRNDGIGTKSTITNPYVWWGFLSNQLVSGIGRSAKVTEALIRVNTAGPDPLVTYPHPELQFYIYLELYFPAGFAGVDLLNKNNGLPNGVPPAVLVATGSGVYEGAYGLGAGADVYLGTINALDLPITMQNTNSLLAYVPDPIPPINTSTDPTFITSNPSSRSRYHRKAPQADLSIPYSSWQDTILKNDAGVDFYGVSTKAVDPDQYRAKLYHPWALAAPMLPGPDGILGTADDVPNPNAGKYMGTEPLVAQYNRLLPLQFGSLSTTDSVNSNGAGNIEWYPGQYRTITNAEPFFNAYYQMRPGATSVTFSGGLIVTGFTNQATTGQGGFDPDPAPLEAAVRGGVPGYQWSSYDATDLATGLAWSRTPGNPAQTTQPTDGAMTLRDRVAPGSDSGGVIPINFTVPVPATATDLPNSVWYDVQVEDPLVNKFPGDWLPKTNVTNTSTAGTLPATKRGITTNYSGWNSVSSSATPYKDPDSFWLPTLDPTIPRSARMPNIGYLQYLRTGIIPDNETVPLSQQKGAPFRLLNFAPSADGSQVGATTPFRTAGYAYPDWAILDLFTVPSTLLPFGGPYGYFKYAEGWQAGSVMSGTPATMRSYSTFGGSTPGRINPNGAVIYTTNVNAPATDDDGNLITRTLPLQALLYGLKVNQTIPMDGSSGVNAPIPTGGTAVDAAAISTAIADYISANGPLRMPSEICNIPAIADLYPNDTTHKNRTRNDLVRQIVGNLTTQSNTFSVWVAGQSIQKVPGHTNYGEFETGDNVLSEVRYHFIVERYLDPGADGVYGNTSSVALSAGFDGKVGTYDDLANSATSAQPPNPAYLYRVIFSEEIR